MNKLLVANVWIWLSGKNWRWQGFLFNFFACQDFQKIGVGNDQKPKSQSRPPRNPGYATVLFWTAFILGTSVQCVMMWNCLCGYWMSGPSVSLLVAYPIWTGTSFKGDVRELRPQGWPYGRHAEEHFVSWGEKQEATLRQFWSSLLIFSHISSVFLS